MDGGALGVQNYAVESIAVFKDRLHVGTYCTATGGQVWSSADGTSWTRVDAGLGPNNGSVASMAAYKDCLYVGTWNSAGSGCAVWGSGETGGPPYTDWQQMNAGGFGDTNNNTAESMAVHGGYLYVGTANNAGCQVWRTAADVPAPSDWGQAGAAAFGDANNHAVSSLRSWGGALYAGTRNAVTGCELWSWDGSAWSQEGADGFGDASNYEVSAMAEYFGGLFVGTTNEDSGCQVWNAGSVWYLAEGATDGGFETWVLVQNPGAAPAHVDFTLNTDAGEVKPPELQGVEIPAGSRRSFNLGNYVTSYNVSTKVESSDGLVICERAMYWTPPGQG